MFVYVFAGGQYLQEEFHPLPNDRINLKYDVHLHIPFLCFNCKCQIVRC